MSEISKCCKAEMRVEGSKDFVGKKLSIGDDVVFMQLGYRVLKLGKIIKITPKTILIGHENFNVGGTTTKQFPDQVVKINLNKN